MGRVESLVKMLSSSKEKDRAKGMDKLKALSETDLAPEEGKELLRAAARKFPPAKYDWQEISESLIEALWKFPKDDYVPIIREEFPKYDERARFAALRLLTEAGTTESLSAFMDLMRQYMKSGDISDLMLVFVPLEHEPRHPEVLFPGLFEFASIEKLGGSIYGLCLKYREQNLLDPYVLEPFSQQIVEDWKKYDEKLGPMQRDSGVDWMWLDEYQSLRHDAGVILDLMGYFAVDKVERSLRKALEYKDPRLSLFALLSLVRLGQDVEPHHIEKVAASSEARRWLFEKLKEMSKDHLFPEGYRTQEALAESCMVDWLCFPTELARVPDEIQLMKVFTFENEDGVFDYFIFRFRSDNSDWKQSGWMAGVAGPFPKRDEPTTEDRGGTFSSFESWESRTPEQHLEHLVGIVAQAAEYQNRPGGRTSSG